MRSQVRTLSRPPTHFLSFRSGNHFAPSAVDELPVANKSPAKNDLKPLRIRTYKKRPGEGWASLQHSRAIAQSSCAAKINTRTFESVVEMSCSIGDDKFFAGSMARPRKLKLAHAAARTSAEFSPIPA